MATRSGPTSRSSTASRRSSMAASGTGARHILELGTGTGETARRLLARHTEAPSSASTQARRCWRRRASRLPADRVRLRVARLEEPLPDGKFDLVASALAVHHLTTRQGEALRARRPGPSTRRQVCARGPGGPRRSGDAVTALTPALIGPARSRISYGAAGSGLAPRVTFSMARSGRDRGGEARGLTGRSESAWLRWYRRRGA